MNSGRVRLSVDINAPLKRDLRKYIPPSQISPLVRALLKLYLNVARTKPGVIHLLLTGHGRLVIDEGDE